MHCSKKLPLGVAAIVQVEMSSNAPKNLFFMLEGHLAESTILV